MKLRIVNVIGYKLLQTTSLILKELLYEGGIAYHKQRV
jgi:hypothetical protein